MKSSACGAGAEAACASDGGADGEGGPCAWPTRAVRCAGSGHSGLGSSGVVADDLR